MDKVKKNVKKKRSNSVSDARDFHDVKVVVNEVLTYVSFHFAQCSVESILVAVGLLNFYDPGSEAHLVELWDICAQHLHPYASFFSGVYSWLVKVLGQFSIIYFRGL